jgi:hypothetical protein
MFELSTAREGMLELMYGDKSPSLLFAFRTAALSAMQPLEANGEYARMLAPYANRRLPERDVLEALLRSYHGPHSLYHTHFDTLYVIDELYFNHVIDQPVDDLDTFEKQSAWRERLVKLIKGMSYKTVSMALLIYMPLTCELVPIDRHHLRRYGFDPDKSLTRCKYLGLEARMQADRNNEGYPDVPLGLYTAYYWGVQRDGEECYRNGRTSHQKMSCRWY